MKRYEVKDNETFVSLYKLETTINKMYDEFFFLESRDECCTREYQDLKRRIKLVKECTKEKYQEIMNDRDLHIDIIRFISAVDPTPLETWKEAGLLPEFNRFWRIAKTIGPLLLPNRNAFSHDYDEEEIDDIIQEHTEIGNHALAGSQALDDEIDKRVLLNLNETMTMSNNKNRNSLRAEGMYKILYYNYLLEDAFLDNVNFSHWDFVEEFYDQNTIKFAGEEFFPVEDAEMVEDFFLDKMDRVLETSLNMGYDPEVKLLSQVYLKALYEYNEELTDIHMQTIIREHPSEEVQKDVMSLHKTLVNSGNSK